MRPKLNLMLVLTAFSVMLIFTRCNEAPKAVESADKSDTDVKTQFAGYESREKWGEHLVTIGGCGDCHTPKKMTERGPEQDSSLNLSGHPAGMPAPDVNRKEIEGKGLGVTQTLTAWVGPWGISYASNLTSDATGIGNWSEETFFTAIRHGKSKGVEANRPIMPPMPWASIAKMSDEELRAVFAYLKSTKPINNLVPEYQPPVMAAAH
jgi:mono/diheme cytochrome c family protein